MCFTVSTWESLDDDLTWRSWIGWVLKGFFCTYRSQASTNGISMCFLDLPLELESPCAPNRPCGCKRDTNRKLWDFLSHTEGYTFGPYFISCVFGCLFIQPICCSNCLFLSNCSCHTPYMKALMFINLTHCRFHIFTWPLQFYQNETSKV